MFARFPSAGLESSVSGPDQPAGRPPLRPCVRAVWRLVACAAFVVQLGSLAAADVDLRVGRAQVRITPPVGSVIGNSYGVSIAKGVTSDLHAKAVVFESGGVTAAIVACDLISLHRPIVERTRALLAQRTGLAPDRVILAATHCHGGPQTHPLFLETVGGEARRLSESYVEALPGMIAESVRLAEADLQPARLFFGKGHEDALTYNRRFLMRDGSVIKSSPTNAGAVRSVGPIDPDVGVIYIEGVRGQPLVTVVNFAAHVGGGGFGMVAAHYPHYLAEVLARVKGEAMLTVFFNGMSGNVNPNNNTFPGSVVRALHGDASAAGMGSVLAGEVIKAYPHLKSLGPGKLQVRSQSVRVPVAPAPSPAELEKARATVLRHGKGAGFNDVILAWRALDLAAYGKDGLWDSEVQAITFGRELAFIGYPGDSFVELGLAMKQNSPFALTLVSEQAGNGSLSYIPNAKAFPEGSYEVISARVVPGGGEVLVDAAVRLLTEMFHRK